MNIAIVEDAAQDSQWLQGLLSEYGGSRGLALQTEFFSNGEDFLRAVEPERFDMCFMDIFLPGISGMEAAQRLRSIDPECLLVFLTCSPDYMAEGYRLRAWRYLLKPVSREGLCETMSETAKYISFFSRRLEISVRGQEISLSFSKIYYVSTANRAVEIHGREACITTNSHVTFSALTAPLLQDSRFVPVGKGVVVNLQHVEKVDDDCVAMTNGDRLPISRRKRGAVSAALVRFQFEMG